MKLRTVQRTVGLSMALVLIASPVVWWITRDPLPGTIRIATAEVGGLYHELASALGEHLERRTGRKVQLLPSKGSVENRELLRGGATELAIMQAAAVPLSELAVLAPLYPEVLHVIVRRGSEVAEVRDIAQRSFALGREGSGMRASTKLLFEHYRMQFADVRDNDAYFLELEQRPELEGAVVTTGIGNPDLARLFASGNYRVLGVRDARAIALRNPFFDTFELPRGLYFEGPPVPEQALRTVATTALLVAGPDVPEQLVDAVLSVLYEDDLRSRFPALIREADAIARSPVAMHPAARRYIDPFGHLSSWNNLFEGLAGLKELIFGLAALAYLTWDGLRRMRSAERRRELQAQKDHLDGFLEQTIEIERRHMETEDPNELRALLEEITQLKLNALRELTHEDLRGDRMFSIFLLQCANVIRRIQTRIHYRDPEPI